jgi:hypothetical protein
MYFPRFLRRRFRASLREPTLNFVYRATGFALMTSLGAGTVIANYCPTLVRVPALWMAVGAAFGGVLLLTGFASTEAWEWAMSRVNFEAYASPYGREKLALFTGILSVAIVVVVLLLVL